MNRVLVAVSVTKTSKSALSIFDNLVRPPDEVILLHVERLEGTSLMIDMLGDAELETLRKELKDTDYKKNLDRKAGEIIDYYKSELENRGVTGVKTMIKAGIPAEEILKTAEEEKVELIILGHNGNKGLNRLIAGSVARDVEKKAKVPVLVTNEPVMSKETSNFWRDAFYIVSLSTVLVSFMFALGILAEKMFVPY
jgi:nucleotide-binding universal stress UspA family protein